MQATQSDADPRAALERFVVDNDDLLQLESLIGRFNIFDALGIARAEIRHSNFLAFLLDPAESHGLSALFLRALVMDLLKSAPISKRPFSPIEIDGTEFRGVEVRREWNHIDLLIRSEQPAFVLTIENKVDAAEHGTQLDDYWTEAREEFADSRHLFVYLTRDGAPPTKAKVSMDAWLPYSYRDLFRVFSRTRQTYANAIGDDVLVFLDHYLSLIETRFMDSPEIDDLCRRIYKNHRQALQLIHERVGSPASGIVAEIEAVFEADPRWHMFQRTSSSIDFVPRDWLDWLPDWGLDYKAQPKSWLVMRIEVGKKTAASLTEVRQMADTTKRKQIIGELLKIKEPPAFGRNQSDGPTVGDRYTRVSSRKKLFEWIKDTDPDPALLRTAVTIRLNEIHAKLPDVYGRLKDLLESSGTSVGELG